MIPKLLFLACAFCIVCENIIIDRKFAGLSPLGSQPIYALCYLVICASLYPLSDHLRMTVNIQQVRDAWPWIVLAGLIFATGAVMYFQAFSKGGNAQLAMTMASTLPILTAAVLCVLERRLPTARVLISCALAVSAVMVLRPEVPNTAPPSQEQTNITSDAPDGNK